MRATDWRTFPAKRSARSLREDALVLKLNEAERRLGKIDAVSFIRRLFPDGAKFSAEFDPGQFDVDPSAPLQITMASLRQAIEVIAGIPQELQK